LENNNLVLILFTVLESLDYEFVVIFGVLKYI